MKNGKFIVARLWPKFSGGFPSGASVIFGINPRKYETICIYLVKNSSSPNIFEQKGKKVFYIIQNSKPPALSFTVFFKLAKILRNEGVDILHCHRHKSTFYGTIAAKMANVPIILTHVHGMDRTRNLKRKILNRFLFSHVNRIFAVGEAVKDDILQNNPVVYPEKVINIGNSIDLDYFSSIIDKQIARRKFGIADNAFIFATAGRFSKNKGQSYLIRAFAEVKKKMPNAHLLIAGDGQLKDSLKKEATNSGFENATHFLGKIDDMPAFYSAIDVFVLPSIGSEGLPKVLIEAMAAGILCIATNVGGTPDEILVGGRYGLLVPHSDTNALVEAMLNAANMPQQEKQETISAAKTHIRKNYSHAVVVKKLEKIYETEINQHYEANKRQNNHVRF
jgi:glycosyltransferase involved in cell wall biosynthesis